MVAKAFSKSARRWVGVNDIHLAFFPLQNSCLPNGLVMNWALFVHLCT